MTVTIGTGSDILRPETSPLKSSVLDHARAAGNVHDLSETEGFGWRNDNGLWVSYNGIETLVPTPICPEPLLSDTGAFKTFDFAEWQPALTFAVHGGVQCRTVGLDKADQQAELDRVFTANEGKGVEQALLGNRFVAQVADAANPLGGSWAAPIDLTPVTDTVSPRVAVALLEGWAARHYAGVPTLHLPRALGTILGGDVIEWKGDLAFTRMGSKVAFGGGYDDEDQDGTFILYATGEVFVERSSSISINSITMPNDGSGTGSGENGLAPNTAIALVERMFRVAVDVFVAKATATVPAVTGGGFGV
ncbi:hypothetical protein [Aeromicrobium sp.]|uniref:hypothetical protein n=1 Tax=Aeromicrobium sp. TaxID=1871063 RepID=UPI00198B3CFE|nr:hypothetical protein [Aeromicrobium sp.]MBC7630416.1 hypothetical protein [Aeromicrobium sp.]